jgi:hypothetical protein
MSMERAGSTVRLCGVTRTLTLAQSLEMSFYAEFRSNAPGSQAGVRDLHAKRLSRQ